MMKFSDTLLAKIRYVLSHFKGPDLSCRDHFLNNFVFLWHTMRASEDLLQLAVECSDGELRDYFAEHLEEERSHQEWLAADLASAGVDVKNSHLPRLAVELVGSQFYRIKYVDAASL